MKNTANIQIIVLVQFSIFRTVYVQKLYFNNKNCFCFQHKRPLWILDGRRVDQPVWRHLLCDISFTFSSQLLPDIWQKCFEKERSLLETSLATFAQHLGKLNKFESQRFCDISFIFLSRHLKII